MSISTAEVCLDVSRHTPGEPSKSELRVSLPLLPTCSPAISLIMKRNRYSHTSSEGPSFTMESGANSRAATQTRLPAISHKTVSTLKEKQTSIHRQDPLIFKRSPNGIQRNLPPVSLADSVDSSNAVSVKHFNKLALQAAKFSALTKLQRQLNTKPALSPRLSRFETDSVLDINSCSDSISSVSPANRTPCAEGGKQDTLFEGYDILGVEEKDVIQSKDENECNNTISKLSRISPRHSLSGPLARRESFIDDKFAKRQSISSIIREEESDEEKKDSDHNDAISEKFGSGQQRRGVEPSNGLQQTPLEFTGQDGARLTVTDTSMELTVNPRRLSSVTYTFINHAKSFLNDENIGVAPKPKKDFDNPLNHSTKNHIKLSIKMTSKEAARKDKVRRLWSWAIRRVLQLVQAVGAFSKKLYCQIDGIDAGMKAEGTASNSNQLSFNMDAYKISNSIVGSYKIKAALMKPKDHRTQDDLTLILTMIKRLSAFSRYNDAKRRALSRAVQYSRFGPGRTIVKQGHAASCFYVVLSGDLEVTKLEDQREYFLTRLTAGMVFGELGLIKDLNRREATVVALKEVELLWVTKDDFAEILEEEALTDFNDRKHRFSKDRFWAQFGPIGINNLVKTAQSFEVPAETMIFAEGDIASFVYFICDGDCRMAKVFSFEKIPVSPDSKEFKLRKYTGNPLSAPKQNRLVHKLISFSSVRRGAVFGAASVLAMAGTANQLATMRTMCDVSALTPFPFSLVTKTRVRYIAVKKNEFVRELVAHPQILREAILQHVVISNVLTRNSQIQDLYLERREWDHFKRGVLQKWRQPK